ncbi:diguanylate cyclase [Limnochorda pilosa]|nr:diguanylate cyclase [Limnochorda pilosa]
MPDDFQTLLHDVEATLDRLRREFERLQHLILTDELTGLYNRRYLELRLEEELNRARRYERPFSLVFLDLDGFKDVNEQFGHPAGDRLLMELAEVLRESARTMDIAVRHGGEEFLLLLPETDAEAALRVGRRLQRQVEARGFLGGRLHITLSGGVASYPTDGDDGRTLVERADLALRIAKRQGKNRVVCATEVGAAPGGSPVAPPVAEAAPDVEEAAAGSDEPAVPIPVVPGFRAGQALPACFWTADRPLVVRGLLGREPGEQAGSQRYRFDTDHGPQLIEHRRDGWFWLAGLEASLDTRERLPVE